MANTNNTSSNNHQRRTRAATESLGFLLTVGGILVALNVLGYFAWTRIDTTEKELFSLSSGSKNVAKSLSDKLTITAYFTKDLPPPFNATERYVRDLLTEYASASGGKITVTFINPAKDAEKEKAKKDGVTPVNHQVVENDGVSVREGYRGLVMRYLDKTEVIPVIQDTEGLEYLLTTRMKKLIGDRITVGIVTGLEGPTSAEGLKALARCLPMYDFKDVDLGKEIPADLRAVLLVAPTIPIPDDKLQYLNKYVMNGGDLGVFGGTMKVSFEGGMTATPTDSRIDALLKPWGVSLGSGVVADAVCGRAPMRTEFGQVAVPHPPVPMVSFDKKEAEHPAAFRLGSTPLPFSAPLQVSTAPAGVNLAVLAKSSETSWLLTGSSIDLAPRDPRQWRQAGASGPFPLLVALDGKLPSAFPNNQSAVDGAPPVEAPAASVKPVRVFVAGSSYFMRDEAMPPVQEGSEECPMAGNVALALNVVDWLAQDSDLVAIRAKNVEDPTIEVPADVRAAEDEAKTAATKAVDAVQKQDAATAEGAVAEQKKALEKRKAALEKWESKKATYRWGNMIGIPALFGLFGIVRWQIRQRRRRNLSL